MCPFCISTLGLVVATTVSTGGLGALAIKISRNKNTTLKTISDQKAKEQ